MILGVAWLTTLGEVKVNWRTLAMNFCMEGKKVHIVGDHRLSRMLVTLKALKKEKEIEAVFLVWGMESADQSSPNQSLKSLEARWFNVVTSSEFGGGFEGV